MRRPNLALTKARDSALNLEGKTAVVTGASRGIGRAIAVQLAEAGADVLICANQSVEAANEVSKELQQVGVRSTVLQCDITDTAQLDEMLQRSWSWRGSVDIWVNNAGADVLTGSAATWSFDQKLQRLWEVDVCGTIRCGRQIGQRMKQAGRGVILNIGWDQVAHGMEGDSGEMFAAAKGAIMAFTMSLAKSLAPEVRVNCVAPGWIKTAWGEGAKDYWNQRAIGESLVARWGTPQDVAGAVCFLASDAASFINGQVLPVNGGFRTASDVDGE